MKNGFGLRVLVIVTFLAICVAFSYSPDIRALDGYDAMPGGPLTSLTYTGGWFVQGWYMDMDSCWSDSAYSMVDTQYTGWVHAGKDWEVFWFQFHWNKFDSSCSIDSLDTLESVVIQGCLDPVNFPTTYDFCTAFSLKTDTFWGQWYQRIDSLTHNPALPWMRAQIIFETTNSWDNWCPIHDTITTIDPDYDQEEFEMRWKFLDVY